jgi:hypothetical protein
VEGREAGECAGETCAFVCVRGGGGKEMRRARASARAAKEGGEEEGGSETGCVRAEGLWPGRDTLGACRAPPSICPVQTPPNNAELFRVWLVGGGSPPDPPLHCPRPQGHLRATRPRVPVHRGAAVECIHQTQTTGRAPSSPARGLITIHI